MIILDLAWVIGIYWVFGCGVMSRIPCLICEWCMACLESLKTWGKCQKSVASRYWYDAWWRGARRQAIESQNSGSGHYLREAPGGVVQFAKRWQSGRAPVWCLALGGVRCPPGSLEPGFTWRRERHARRFWCSVGVWGGFLHSFRWCSWCDALAGGPVTSATCIGEHVATLGCSLVV